MTEITKVCAGCSACQLICPNLAIKMIEDDEGFLSPSVNKAICNDCKLCVDKCPQNTPEYFIRKENNVKVIAARYKNDKVLEKSASGGFFAGLAAKVLSTPGNVVFGCAFDEDIVARHICISHMNDIPRLQSSKYVQSDIGTTYLQVRDALEKGAMVFYTGTPCQIAGLYAFLGEDHKNLITADLICHGVPSPALFKRYINELAKKNGGKIIYHNFRYKGKKGWGATSLIKTKTKTKTKIKEALFDPYYYSFGSKDSILREVCYVCPYASPNRVADFTLGDFWGIEKVHPEFFDRRGVSAVIISTEKGKKFFEQIKNEFEFIESTIENINQIHLQKPALRPSVRDIILKGVCGEDYIVHKNLLLKLEKKVLFKEYARKILPRWAVRFLLKLYKYVNPSRNQT